MRSNGERKYYDLFLQNTLPGQHYRIKLSDGKTLAGVPKAYSSRVNLENPTFFINGSKFFLCDVVDAEEMFEIIIYANKQLDGYTCRLDPRSKLAIKSQLPLEPAPVASVFISFDSKSSFEIIHGSVWEHIVELLTGLQEEKLQELGGFVFVDAKTMEILFESLVHV